MQDQTQKLSIVEKVGYSLGDSAANFIFQTVMMFLMFFYTDVLGISPVIAGFIFLATRIFDAVNDPMMGAIADRTNTRWGKFRPWILMTAVPFGVIGVLMFTAPNLSAMNKIIYAFITYNLMMIIYTVNNVPYCALTGVLTGDSIERTGLASYRFIFAMLATLAVQSLSIPLVNRLGVDNKTIVQCEVRQDLLAINPKTPGLAKIIVRASDPKGSVTEKEFFTKVTKPVPEIPTVRTSLSDLTLERGFGSYEIDLTPVFDTGAYGPVAYEAAVQNESVAKAEITGNNLKLIEAGIGVTNVTVTAKDRLKSTVNSQFSLAVKVPGDKAPVVKSRPEIVLDKGFGKKEVNLGELFSDTDGDSLVYKVKTDGGIVRANIADSRLTIVEVITGNDRLTVTADDGKGGQCSLVVPVVVKTGQNMPPFMITPLSSKTVSSESEPIQINLSEHFSDPDRDNLTYEVSVVNQAKGYQLAMGIFCSLAVIFFVITFVTTKERVKPDPKQKTSLKQDIKDLTHNPAWVAIFFLTVFIFVYLALRGSVTLYYFTYYVKRADLFSLFNALGMGVTLLGILFAKPLAVRFGKRNTFLVCLFLTAVFATVYAFLPPNAIFLIFAFNVLLSLSYAPTIPMLWAMIADVADYGEWKTGRRATGMAFSATTFGLKMGLSLGGALAGWLLSYFGYVAGADQTDFALKGIVWMMSIIPAAFFFVGVAVLFLYKIDKHTEIQMTEELIERRKHYASESPAAEGA
ncbi:MAG: MFS transporter [Sedimentisphaerales bacterium]|nr:MFS transporter [Sedimentisphaerales bacterium]